MPSIRITAPSEGQRVSGSVLVSAEVTGGSKVSNVRIIIGPPQYGTRTATASGGAYVYRWDTTRKLVDGVTPRPCDSAFWITARATVDGVEIVAPYVGVITANTPRPEAGAVTGGWRSDLAWAAQYGGTFSQWKSSHHATIGSAYARLEDDPIHGSRRRVIKAAVPNRAKSDPDQTSGTVRFQSSSRQNLREGDEFCVGFSYLPSASFPSVYPPNDPANPNGPAGTAYIALFQLYGPPYQQGSPFLIHANRDDTKQPIDEFAIRGNELNAGDPWPFLSGPYNRGRWTDVVFKMRLSTSIEHGWVETYVNQGQSNRVQSVPFVNGLRRVPRVLLRPDSQGFRTDMQIYRVADKFEWVTVWHTAHRIARTVEEADPRSYDLR